jgi:hypothetical protein
MAWTWSTCTENATIRNRSREAAAMAVVSAAKISDLRNEGVALRARSVT